MGFVSRARWGVQGLQAVVNSSALNHTAGNLLVVAVSHDPWLAIGAEALVITDTAGDTFTEIVAPFDGGFDHYHRMFATITAGHASNVITATHGTNGSAWWNITCFEFSGTQNVASIVTSATGSASSGTALSTSSLSVSTPSVIIARGLISNGGNGGSMGTGYTGDFLDPDGTVNNTTGGWFDAYKDVTASEAASVTANNSGTWAMVGVVVPYAGAGAARPFFTQLGAKRI